MFYKLAIGRVLFLFAVLISFIAAVKVFDNGAPNDNSRTSKAASVLATTVPSGKPVVLRSLHEPGWFRCEDSTSSSEEMVTLHFSPVSGRNPRPLPAKTIEEMGAGYYVRVWGAHEMLDQFMVQDSSFPVTIPLQTLQKEGISVVVFFSNETSQQTSWLAIIFVTETGAVLIDDHPQLSVETKSSG